MNGRFIVVDGVDGAGKGTQIALLRDAIAGSGRTVHVTAEPSEWPIGQLIRRYLRKELTDGVPGWQSMALLFAADRMQHVEHEILPRLARGEVVLCDRYDASSIAYQSALLAMAGGGDVAASESMEWIAAVNAHAKRPDLTLVLDLDPDLAAERRRGRGSEAELFEKIELQRRVRAHYAQVPRFRPTDRIETIDASPSPADVFARIWQIVEPLVR